MSAPLNNCSKIQNYVNLSMKVLNQFNWLIDSYVLDFYTEDHWNRLPSIWKSTLEGTEPEILTDLFKSNSATIHDKIVWPLSLLCLRTLINHLSISRHSQNVVEVYKLQPEPLGYYHPKLKVLFRKKVKTKKQHEIERMGALTARTAADCNVNFIVDFGAGLGHLSRILGFGYGLNVCCLEQQKELTEQARTMDHRLEQTAKTVLAYDDIKRIRRPVHLNLTLTKHTNIDDLLNQICDNFSIPNDERESFRFGICGLHPCGDLASILLNTFLQCKNAKFLNIVGCCYMKMTESSFPQSLYFKNRQYNLSYQAKEIACHAKEVYVQRLAEKNYENLKVHSYRAALEKLICKNWPSLKHSGLKNNKFSENLSFSEYCIRAMSHLKVNIPDTDISSADVTSDLNCWKKIVIFYTLRLVLAPLVESLILYDRMLCVFEKNKSAELEAIFDPFISPRNHVMTVRNSNYEN